MTTKELELVLNDMEEIVKLDKIAREDINPLGARLRLQRSREYLEAAFVTKPEDAASRYLFEPLLELLIPNAKFYTQAVAGAGWVDYLISASRGNPVVIELKPLHHKVLRARGEAFLVRSHLEQKLEEYQKQFQKEGKNQITIYLRRYDYVILTNLVEVACFNRQAVADFKPFYRESFHKFVDAVRMQRNVWEIARRWEDQVPKHDLDRAFFEDLKRWYARLSEVRWIGSDEQVNEIKILLLNKFIFAQTLEDLGLIPYRFLQKSYTDSVERWGRKGTQKVVAEFFDSIDEWFFAYYDTELFRDKVLNYVCNDPANLRVFQQALEDILGFGTWNRIFSKGLTFYNYRYIDEDIFGKSYEMFLAEHRKERGIYYTPREITEYMARRVVEETFGSLKEQLLEAIKKGLEGTEIAKRFVRLAIVDPACGSGSFLVKVFREIYKIYVELQGRSDWAEHIWHTAPEDVLRRREAVLEIRSVLGIRNGAAGKRRLVSLILLRHIYGIDVDERAVDIARVNVWKEAIKLCPEAFHYDVLPEEASHVLPALKLNIVCGDSVAVPPDHMVVEALKDKKGRLGEIVARWKDYLDKPFSPQLAEVIASMRAELKREVLQHFRLGVPTDKVSLLPVDFCHIYFDEEGNPILGAGFEGVIGNPPWENIKPVRKEFAARFPEVFGDLTKFSVDGIEFERLFEKAVRQDDVRRAWNEYVDGIRALSTFFRLRYPLCGRGDLSYQKVFLQRALEIATKVVVMLIPADFDTHEGFEPLRRRIFTDHSLKEVLSFENRSERWFQGVDSRYKFNILVISKEKKQGPIKARFYIRDWKEVELAFDYPADAIEKLSPLVAGITEFRELKDYDIAVQIRNKHELLGEKGYSITSEFHMTNDNILFIEVPAAEALPLYEGKMIHQFDPYYAKASYWIEETKGRSRLLKKEIMRIKRMLVEKGTKELGLRGKRLRAFVADNVTEAIRKFETKELKLEYEVPRLVYRAVARSTDERTLIASIVPARVFLGHSLNYFRAISYTYETEIGIVQRIRPVSELLFLLAMLNSFVVDYYIRLRISANLTTFFLYELPLPDCPDELRKRVVGSVLRLFKDYVEPLAEVKRLRELVGVEGIQDAVEWKTERARLEVLVARDVFGLDTGDIKYILDTFVYGDVDKELVGLIKEESRNL
jgi:hypothetical protein